jgi:hypothetical protein
MRKKKIKMRLIKKKGHKKSKMKNRKRRMRNSVNVTPLYKANK